MYYYLRWSISCWLASRCRGVVVDNAYLLVNAVFLWISILDLWRLAVSRLLPGGGNFGHSNNVPSAHRADLCLDEPISQALIMKDMRAVRNPLERLAIFELPQADWTVHVLESVLIICHWLKQSHVSLCNLFCIGAIHVFKPLSSQSALSELIEEETENDHENH